jgi:hypothetical protein
MVRAIIFAASACKALFKTLASGHQKHKGGIRG